MTRYVLVTAARNEARHLPALVESVARQTLRPRRWAIVSDRSTDGTDDLVRDLARAHPWIVPVLLQGPPLRRGLAGSISPYKVRAIRRGREHLARIDHEFFGVLDADVTLPDTYYEDVLGIFARDARIGIAGGGVYSVYDDGSMDGRGFVQPHFVGGPVQLFRTQCWDDIGGYVPHGHEDVLAVAMSKACGWRVVCDASVRALHHDQQRQTFADKIPTCFRMGAGDYVMRTSSWFELIRALRRMAAPPFVLAGVSQWVGYLSAALLREPQIPASARLRRFLVREERHKLRVWARRAGSILGLRS